MLRSYRAERSAAETNPSRLKDEPRRGFISICFFRSKASFQVSFSSGDERAYFVLLFFKASRLPLRPKKMCDERLF